MAEHKTLQGFNPPQTSAKVAKLTKMGGRGTQVEHRELSEEENTHKRSNPPKKGVLSEKFFAEEQKHEIDK